MATITCDCGCGETITKKVFFSDACRKRFVRHGGQKVRQSGQDVQKTDTLAELREIMQNAANAPTKVTEPVSGHEEREDAEGNVLYRMKPGLPWYPK